MSIPLAIVFVFVCEMGVLGLWVAMAIGITLQATSYTLLVLRTDWQAVANEAEQRIAEEQAKIHLDSFNSIQSYGSTSSKGSNYWANTSLNNTDQSFMRARD